MTVGMEIVTYKSEFTKCLTSGGKLSPTKSLGYNRFPLQ